MENISMQIEQAKKQLKASQDRARTIEHNRISAQAQLEQIRTQEEEVLNNCRLLGCESLDHLQHMMQQKSNELQETLAIIDRILKGEYSEPVEDLILPEFVAPLEDDVDDFSDFPELVEPSAPQADEIPFPTFTEQIPTAKTTDIFGATLFDDRLFSGFGDSDDL